MKSNKFFIKVIEASKVTGARGTNIKCVLGDETAIVHAFLEESEHLAVGNTVALFGG